MTADEDESEKRKLAWVVLLSVTSVKVSPVYCEIRLSAYRNGLARLWRGPLPLEPLHGEFGDYDSWEEAASKCGDAYAQRNVLEKTLELTRSIQPSEHLSQIDMRLLAAIQYAAMHTPNSPLRVLDFGGALGSHYFRLRRFLPTPITWCVVELAATAKMGTDNLANNELRFVAEIGAAGEVDIVIASGSLQYAPKPYEVLETLKQLSPYLIVDKMTLWERDRIVIQHIHPLLFQASFPKWLLSRESFLANMEGFHCVLAWDLPGYATPIDGKQQEIYKGFLFERL